MLLIEYVELCGLKNGEKLGQNDRAKSQAEIAKGLGINPRTLSELLEIERK